MQHHKWFRASGHAPGSTHLHQVYIVNSNPAVNSVTKRILSEINVTSQEFLTPSSVMQALPMPSPACFLIDFVQPEIHGLQLMDVLRRSDCFQPCIFISSRIDPELIVTAMNRGAYGFLKRPFDAMELIDMVQRALNQDQALSPYITEALNYRSKRSKLSNREREILALLELGQSARQVGATLNLSYRTVENHRARIFQKLETKNGSQLIQRATTLNLLRAHGTID